MADTPTSPSPLIFDRALIRARRRRAALLGPATFLLDRVADDLAERLGAVLRRFDLALDLGTPGEAVRAALHRLGSVATIVAADAMPAAGAKRAASAGDRRRGGVAVPRRLRSISSSRRWRCNSSTICRASLVQIRRALKPDGLFLAALIGGDTLTELRQSFAAAESEIEGGVSPRVAPFADLRDLGALLQRAGFALPVTDVDRVTVRYDSVLSP